ncbi:MAG: ABC transporter ATP-binding protein [Thermomicrobiales bacterium]
MAIPTPAPASPATPIDPAHDGPPIIAIRGLTKRYKGFTAVDGIDLEVRPGEIFGILGPNGAGKTTTLEMIEGLRTPDAGTITVAGLDAVAQSDEVRKIIGVQLQSTSLFPYLSAAELVELFGHMYGTPNPKARVPELLHLVGLEGKAKARVDEMSGGQQQRLSIALALVNQPTVTFLDEPTTGLDPHARRSLWQTILGVRDAGTTVVLTTHYMEEAEVLCDRIAIMDGGHVIACDTPSGLIRALGQEATVSAAIERRDLGHGEHAVPALPSQEAFAAIHGVTVATLSDDGGEMGHRVRLQTADTQATLVGLLELAKAQDLVLGDLSSSRATLEDVFIQRTGRTYVSEDAGQRTEDRGRRKRRRM